MGDVLRAQGIQMGMACGLAQLFELSPSLLENHSNHRKGFHSESGDDVSSQVMMGINQG